MNSKTLYASLEKINFIRVSRTIEEKQAAEIIKKEIEETNNEAIIEYFDVRDWKVKKQKFYVNTPEYKEYEVTAYGCSLNTNGPLTAPFYYFDSYTKVSREKAKGKIVLVNGYLTYGTDVYFCQGDYVPVDYIEADFTTYTIDELYEKVLGDEVGDTTLIDTAMAEAGITLDEIAKEIHLYEVINSTQGGADELFFYDQMMSLAKKILTGNVDRYVYLADLKKLDASYNADLDNLEGITVLTSLSDLNVAYCYIADLTNVDWELMTNLRKLNLAYNYISDLSPLTELTTLKSLNLSNNLLAGSLEITEQQYQKLFKKLEELDLSGNKISDITSLLIYLDYLTGGDYANYIAKEDTIDINLNNQNLVIEIISR